MKMFYSEIYGEISQPGSFNELLNLTLEYGAETNLVRMWRGQADISWPIHSSAFRRILMKKEIPSEIDLINYEKRMLKQADHKGYRYLEGRRLSDLELLARLQHHGAATRLMDFTRSALVALWFCCSSQPNNTGLLLGVHSDYLCGYESELDERPYKDFIKKLENLKHPVTWEPPNVSKRISAQHAQFLYSRVSNSMEGSLELPKDDGANLFIAVTPEVKKMALIILETVFDIREYTLFPDLDGFCYANRTSNSIDSMLRW